eukprot:GILJ01006537.1.p1 GENE.GILJ01006537.1~~GILJ01006537.1.p1  ORF type:complete len:444 (+),score=56.87 GILJ01006537.1:167-1333(+)
MTQLFDALPQPTVDAFWHETLPFIANLALRLPDLFPTPLQILVKQRPETVTLTREQVACLIASGFLCILTPQMRDPELTFQRFYDFRSRSQCAKLECFLHYFTRISEQMPHGNITISRVVHTHLLSSKDLMSRNTELTRFTIHEAGSIEDASGMIQGDFANKIIGGGVLIMGNVQEEIRFTVSPECLASLFFTEEMDSNEAVLIVGSERFAAHSGYGGSLQFDGPFEDREPFDRFERKDTQITAFDAHIYCNDPDQQFEEEEMLREVNKALAAFMGDPLTEQAQAKANIQSTEPLVGLALKPIATGNWGCGLFGGDPQLKSMLQWITTSIVGRPMHYYTFRDRRLPQLQEVVTTVTRKQLTVGSLWKLISNYSKEHVTLFNYILRTLK